jgi:GT2 family glycosyltransferase
LKELQFTASFVVHRNYKYIVDAIRSLYAGTQAPFEMFIVVNAGQTDETLELKQKFPQARYIINPSPLGFAANHNQVMRQANTEYVALLNDDIHIHADALDYMINWLDEHPRTAVAGASLFNPDGTSQVSVYSDPTLMRTLYRISPFALFTSQNSQLRRFLLRVGVAKLLKVKSLQAEHKTGIVPIVKGAVMMVRRKAYEEIGLMDETTWAYGEEADWHYRFRKAGWDVAHISEAKVTHYGQGQASLRLQDWLLAEDRKSLLNYYIKHRSGWQALTIRSAIIGNHLIFTLLWLPFRRNHAAAHWSTVLMALRFHRS